MSDKLIKAYFGPGYCPPGNEYGPYLNPNAIYLCFDRGKEAEGAFALGTYNYRHQCIKDLVKYFKADITNINLKDCSVDEVHIYNVLSAYYVHAKKEIVEEAVRIVKKDGMIYIGETRTPEKHTLPQLQTLIPPSAELEVLWSISDRSQINKTHIDFITSNIGLFYTNIDKTGHKIDKNSYVAIIRKN